MRLRTYLLFLALLALIGLCTVHEAIHRTRARYRLGRLIAQEERREEEIARLRAELAHLRSPARLEEANAALGLGREPLVTLPPAGGDTVVWDGGER
jgi:hypothetical protein